MVRTGTSVRTISAPVCFFSVKEKVNIVWLKRDLRVDDHRPFYEAAKVNLHCIVLYFFEPELRESAEYDIRHERFISESLRDLKSKLHRSGNTLNILHGSAVEVFQMLLSQYRVEMVFSHFETGNNITFQRDTAVKTILQNAGVKLKEYKQYAVWRGLKVRKGRGEKSGAFLSARVFQTDLDRLNTLEINSDATKQFSAGGILRRVEGSDQKKQKGGEGEAWKTMRSFFETRSYQYMKGISKPVQSRESCSRLSAYLAFGNLSIRRLYQECVASAKRGNAKNLMFFAERLRWHCHFIQKFESEPRMEFENYNSGYDAMQKPFKEGYFKAWKQGETGYPLVDACMRAVDETGYLNFRMRAMAVSFLTAHLWQPWQPGAAWLGSRFLDFEPGIHYPQFQMQAGITGVNTIRIYNPVKQSTEHDPEGVFIKKYVPELADVPRSYIHEPWKMPLMEQQFAGCIIGVDYPAPIVNLEKAGRYAADTLWKMRKNKAVKRESVRILKRHTERG